mmetsp:Transcript_119808/g.339574  ORF Transcript_119808/g.339574 Transcript_119808/m.339574 type:complete len:212 (-) Transcript_119808:1478-2113(-)
MRHEAAAGHPHRGQVRRRAPGPAPRGQVRRWCAAPEIRRGPARVFRRARGAVHRLELCVQCGAVKGADDQAGDFREPLLPPVEPPRIHRHEQRRTGAHFVPPRRAASGRPGHSDARQPLQPQGGEPAQDRVRPGDAATGGPQTTRRPHRQGELDGHRSRADGPARRGPPAGEGRNLVDRCPLPPRRPGHHQRCLAGSDHHHANLLPSGGWD